MESRTIEIQHRAHVDLARRIAEKLAREIGFNQVLTGELAIVVTELATNLVKHSAENGRIISSAIEENGRKGIEIVSVGSGPGMHDVELAMEDGHSTRGTMGGGRHTYSV